LIVSSGPFWPSILNYTRPMTQLNPDQEHILGIGTCLRVSAGAVEYFDTPILLLLLFLPVSLSFLLSVAVVLFQQDIIVTVPLVSNRQDSINQSDWIFLHSAKQSSNRISIP
jgi:hypothetical protein